MAVSGFDLRKFVHIDFCWGGRRTYMYSQKLCYLKLLCSSTSAKKGHLRKGLTDAWILMIILMIDASALIFSKDKESSWHSLHVKFVMIYSNTMNYLRCSKPFEVVQTFELFQLNTKTIRVN
jgi:hypothetical protein